MNPLRLVVMLGGPSAERAVSLRSGAAVAQALRALGHRVTELDPLEPTWSLPSGTDAVFLALHGTYGEDGTVQEQLETLGVPYTGCDARVSRLAFDKAEAKQRFVAHSVPTARYAVIREPASPLPADLPLPLVVKPPRQGSSVGLRFVDRAEDWPAALSEAFRFGEVALVEERIPGRETTVGILVGVALPVVEVRPKAGGYDYANKYTAGKTDYFCPAEFDPETTRRVQADALAAFASLGGGDYSRVDVMVRPDGMAFVLEVNTLPGMTETSLLPKAAAAAGMDFPALCQRMVDLALRRANQTHANLPPCA
jgi:D-alanine-D-alanine ligase